MKLRMFALAAMFVMLWSAAATVGASDQATGKESTNPPPSAAVTTEKPVAEFPELKYEFDPVVDGTQVTHDFAIKNTGDGPLAVTQVKTG